METGQYQKSIEGFQEGLKINGKNPLAERGLQWAREALAAEKDMVKISVTQMEKVAGDYGPRHITMRENQLYYKRDRRPEFRLIPLSKDTFMLESYAQFRIRIVSDESGQPVKIIGLYIQGNQDESLRNR
jgi:hypothetical protein